MIQPLERISKSFLIAAALAMPLIGSAKAEEANPSLDWMAGRTLCSHMTSCAEARYFIQNCSNTKMDGDGDGVPCESQWCE